MRTSGGGGVVGRMRTGADRGWGSNFCDFLRRSFVHDPKVTQFKTQYNFLGWVCAIIGYTERRLSK